MFFDKFR